MTDFLSQVRAIVGDPGIVGHDQYHTYLDDRRGYYQGRARLIVRPGTTAEVAEVVRLCARHRVSVVPQGGNTGLCGGATPDRSGEQIVVSLSRMNAIREVDRVNSTATVQAGVLLQNLHEAVAEHGLFFPLDLGAKGSCQLGGNIATNAGGINVLRYGSARELVMGVKVVLPDGGIWDGLSKLRKDNTGYDLKQLFIGAEGTLGIITAAVLKLFSAPSSRCTALVAVKNPAAACKLLVLARRTSADSVVSFEYLPRLGLDLVESDPLDDVYQHYVLLELVSGSAGESVQQSLEEILAQGLETGEVLDGVIAQNDSQRDGLWNIRESLPLAQKESVKNDIAVPVSRIAELLDRAPPIVERIAPGARPCPFGHIGDGNIHYNILGPAGQDPVGFRQEFGAKLVEGINDLVMPMGGSFSAEHGVGVLRRGELLQYKDQVEIDLMRRIKAAIDPDNRMNPGKIL